MRKDKEQGKRTTRGLCHQVTKLFATTWPPQKSAKRCRQQLTARNPPSLPSSQTQSRPQSPRTTRSPSLNVARLSGGMEVLRPAVDARNSSDGGKLRNRNEKTEKKKNRRCRAKAGIETREKKNRKGGWGWKEGGEQNKAPANHNTDRQDRHTHSHRETKTCTDRHTLSQTHFVMSFRGAATLFWTKRS